MKWWRLRRREKDIRVGPHNRNLSYVFSKQTIGLATRSSFSPGLNPERGG